MSSQGPACLLPHAPGASPLGIKTLTPNNPQKTILELLAHKEDGVAKSDAHIQIKLQQIYNLGGGNQFSSYEDAVVALMLRDLPEIQKNKQQKVVFIPEAFIPSMPSAVRSVKDYEEQKRKLDELDDESLEKIGFVRGQGGTQNVLGDHTERGLYDELKVHLNGHSDREKFVLLGPCFKTPDSKRNQVEEHDVILISKNEKTCYCIESKYSLSIKAVMKAKEQLSAMQQLLQSYFGDQFVSGEWRYVSLIHHVENKGRKVCSDCEPFIIRAGEISDKLKEIEKKLCNQATTPNHQEYRNIVAGLSFTVLAVGQPLVTRSRIVTEMGKKIEGKKTKKGQVEGQGNWENILFWSPMQASLMLDRSLKFLAFWSAWGTGKTMCLETKAIQRAELEKVTFVIKRSSGHKTLLEMEKEVRFEHYSNITVVGYWHMKDMKDLMPLLQHGSVFIDELVHNSTDFFRDLVMYAKTMPNLPLIWVAMAGIDNGKEADFEPENLKKLMPMFTFAQLDMPLRSTTAVLQAAGLNTQHANKIHSVTGGVKTNITFSVPSNLLPGVETEYFYYDRKDKDQVVQAVKEAREAMLTRMGQSGVAWITDNSSSRLYDWVCEGSRQARPLYHRPPLCYNGTVLSGKNAAAKDVKQWLQNYHHGQEDRDIVLGPDVVRGWEVQTAIIVNTGTAYDTVSNLVMRGMSHVILVKQKK